MNTQEGSVVQYDIKGRREQGRVVHDNANSVRVWYNGTIVTRHKKKHNVTPAPLMDPWCGTFWSGKGKDANSQNPDRETSGQDPQGPAPVITMAEDQKTAP